MWALRHVDRDKRLRNDSLYVFQILGNPFAKFQEPMSLGFCQHDPSIRSTRKSLILVPIIHFTFPIKAQNHTWYAFYREWCRWGILIVPTAITSYWSAERAAPRVAASISCLQAALGNKDSHRLSLFLTSALTGSANRLSPVGALQAARAVVGGIYTHIATGPNETNGVF